MPDIRFESAMKEKEQQFIEFKHRMGHPYEKQAYHLRDFDRFLLKRYPDSDRLSRDIAMEWAAIKPTETKNGYASRLCTLRQFGKYLSSLGEHAFILPDNLRGEKAPLMPYIFSRKSLKMFFGYTDTMPCYYQSTVRHLVAPAMFRLMYCCGLRPREARTLRRSDIDFKCGRIFIRESKGHKDRYVFADQDVIGYLKRYIQKLDIVMPGCTAVFVDRNGREFSYDSQKYLFNHCRDQSGICADGTRNPNLYSFRHSFATHRIYEWFRAGYDLDAYLPVLCSYMGHEHYENTLYYLHFVPEIFSEVTTFDFELFSDLIPEVTAHD